MRKRRGAGIIWACALLAGWPGAAVPDETGAGNVFSMPAIAAAAARLAARRDAGDAATLLTLAAQAARIAAADAQPAPVRDRTATVGPANTRWIAGSGMFESLFAFPDQPARRRGPAVATAGEDAAAQFIAAQRRRGAAAGNYGDLYDNRDRGHSRLALAEFPQLDAVEYAPEAQAIGLDYGLNDRIAFNAPTFGNSSTAISDPAIGRSLPRFAMTSPGSMARIYRLYASNHLYVYPEHRDHDAGPGDLFPANTPYMLISQGSSGSDRPFLRAIALMLAALRPDVKTFLRAQGLIAPTLQMLLRRGLAGDGAAYLEGPVHPSAFDGARLDFGRLARLAASLRRDSVPPAARMAADLAGTTGHPPDSLPEGISEDLFETPAAIGRAARGLARDRLYVLDAGPTVDPNGRPLRFVWRMLRGDPDAVTITPLDPESRRVEIRIGWHERRPAPGRPDLTTDRVDVGLFADNGAWISAPAFLSLVFPSHERREYAPDGRILSVDFAAPDLARRYQDALIFPARDWRDAFVYDDQDRLLGWTRQRADGTHADYTRHGYRVLSRDGPGRPLRAVQVRYDLAHDARGLSVVTEETTDKGVVYGYDGPGDQLGFLEATFDAAPAARP